jgi:hypothetical protein
LHEVQFVEIIEQVLHNEEHDTHTFAAVDTSSNCPDGHAELQVSE